MQKPSQEGITKMLKITTLIENTADEENKLMNEHGLSLYIEVDGLNILFDTGQSGAFIDNAMKLGKDLNCLDYVLISHGHYDHSGGLKTFVESTEHHPTVIVGDEFFKPKYKTLDNQSIIFIGNAFDEQFLLERKIPLIKIEENRYHLSERVIIFHHFNKMNDFEKINKRFFIIDKDKHITDTYSDEIVLGIVTAKGLVVIVGCSHFGIVNILRTIEERMEMPIYAVIGGTHLIEADEERIQKTVDAFHEMKIGFIGVSHCTGELGVQRITSEFPNQFKYNNTGNIIMMEE